MFIAPDPVDTIERFAELSALLDDPHARRAALLSGVGLDERAWRGTEERWMARLREPGGQALADKLGEVYAETRRNLSDSLGPPTEPAPLSPPAATLRSPLPPAPPEGGVVPPPSPPRSARRAPNPLADTLDSPEGVPLRPAVPFAQV
jgi:hypothetical protein